MQPIQRLPERDGESRRQCGLDPGPAPGPLFHCRVAMGSGLAGDSRGRRGDHGVGEEHLPLQAPGVRHRRRSHGTRRLAVRDHTQLHRTYRELRGDHVGFRSRGDVLGLGHGHRGRGGQPPRLGGRRVRHLRFPMALRPVERPRTHGTQGGHSVPPSDDRWSLAHRPHHLSPGGNSPRTKAGLAMNQNVGHPILSVQDVHKAFGGISAVDGCSLSVAPQSVTGLIGPNGAGKSTLFNIIAGLYRPDDGGIWFNDTRIDGLPPYEIVHLGLTKTWQIPHELRNMTVLENLVLGAKANSGEHLLNLFIRPQEVRRDEQRWRARARDVLRLTQLEGLANEHAKSLSGGQKKLLELARVLMTDPALVLLDEPVAGVNPTLAASLMDLIEKLRLEGRTFFLIEHDMNVVMNRCDRVIVMHQGRTIADGTPASVKANPVVIESYLGG